MAAGDRVLSTAPAVAAQAPPSGIAWRKIAGRAGFYLAVLFYVLIGIFPIYWMALTAFRTNADLYNVANFRLFFNMAPTWDHVDLLLNKTFFKTWLVNSYLIAALTGAITLVTAVPAGYALARLRLPGADTLAIAIFLTYLVPSSLLFIPLSRLLSQFNLTNTIWALVLVYPTVTIPFCTWLMRGFFQTIPREIEEAAEIDGCTQVQAAWYVMLPLSRAGVLSILMFAFTLAMQDFIYALTFVTRKEVKPVTLGVVTDLIRGDVFFWGSLMAGALIAALPVAIIYNFFLDEFIAGITSGVGK
jgi:multiple sugar transport system permease protein